MQPEVQTRPDMDIEDDINASLRRFAPLMAARRFFKIQCIGGHVKVRGNSGSPQSKRVLLDHIQKTRGVINVDLSDLYDDETIRLNIGAILSEGIQVNVQFGAVVLISKWLDSNPDILHKVSSVAGIRRIVVRSDGVELNQ